MTETLLSHHRRSRQTDRARTNCRQSKLTEAYLQRIAQFNPHPQRLSARACRVSTRRRQAGRKPKSPQASIAGPLHGVPIALKDIYCTKDIRTTAHSALLKDHIPAHDAFHAHPARAGRQHPARQRLRPGNSPLAARVSTCRGRPRAILGTFAHDPGGSLLRLGRCRRGGGSRWRQWAATPAVRSAVRLRCVALRASSRPMGSLAGRGILPLSFSLDHAGPMCWTAEDCALMMSVLARHDPLDAAASANVETPDFRKHHKVNPRIEDWLRPYDDRRSRRSIRRSMPRWKPASRFSRRSRRGDPRCGNLRPRWLILTSRA